MAGCMGKEGSPHHLGSLIDGEMVDPGLKIVIHSYVIICIQCGMPLLDVRAESAKPAPRRRKPKGASTLGAASNPDGVSTIALD